MNNCNVYAEPPWGSNFGLVASDNGITKTELNTGTPSWAQRNKRAVATPGRMGIIVLVFALRYIERNEFSLIVSCIS